MSQLFNRWQIESSFDVCIYRIPELAFLYLESLMCGIAGIIQTGLAFDEFDVKKMIGALSHRGPDGEGFWHDETGNVFFGHRRLSIIDLSPAAAQPFHYLDRYVVVHNGEIYNYPELRAQLKKLGYGFRTASDTEVLAAAFHCWNDECVDYLDGMFAFAIWDRQARKFFAARDRFGEKPFYYMHALERNAFLFASEIKAFHQLELGNQFNQKMLFNFLTIGYTDNPNQPDETFYLDIKKLPPATFLAIDLNEPLAIETVKYWDIDVEDLNKRISDREGIDQFQELFTRSVARRLRSDVPWGTSLSGGLDSSSVVAAIHKVLGNNVGELPLNRQAVSIVFPGFDRNEEQHIDEVAKKFSLPSRKISIIDDEVPALFDKVIQQQDEPFGSASVLAQFKIYQLARDNAVKVLLDGQGADETLAGYHKYYQWYWQELFRKRRLITSGELTKARRIGVTGQFGLNNIVGALFPDFASVFLEKQYLLHALTHEDLTRDFVHLQSKEAYYTTPTIFTLNGVLYFNTCMHGLEELLRYADRNSMAHGVEVRLPFLSHELVEFVFSLPSNFKIREGWTKWLLRTAMENSLPPSIVWRKDKVGLEPPQSAWMLLPSVVEMIHEAKKKLVNDRILKPEVINRPVRASAAYDKDNYDWRYLVSAQYL